MIACDLWMYIRFTGSLVHLDQIESVRAKICRNYTQWVTPRRMIRGWESVGIRGPSEVEISR